MLESLEARSRVNSKKKRLPGAEERLLKVTQQLRVLSDDLRKRFVDMGEENQEKKTDHAVNQRSLPYCSSPSRRIMAAFDSRSCLLFCSSRRDSSRSRTKLFLLLLFVSLTSKPFCDWKYLPALPNGAICFFWRFPFVAAASSRIVWIFEWPRHQRYSSPVWWISGALLSPGGLPDVGSRPDIYNTVGKFGIA